MYFNNEKILCFDNFCIENEESHHILIAQNDWNIVVKYMHYMVILLAGNKYTYAFVTYLQRVSLSCNLL